MKHILKDVILAFLFIIFSGFHAFADIGQSISSGTQWLISQQNPDGSFGTDSETILLDTVETINALKTQPNTDIELSNALNFLNSYTPLNQDYIARIAGVTNNSLYIQSLVESQNEDGGWGILPDFDSDPLDTTLALQALNTINHSELETIGYALGYLIDNQNIDGGFGFYEGDDSNVYMTDSKRFLSKILLTN
jgi:prenyltransferase beta subunit